MSEKLYKATYTVLFVSEQKESEALQIEALQHTKKDIHFYYSSFDISEVKSMKDVPKDWVKAIPYGDEALTKGRGTTVEDIVEKNLIVKLAGL